MTKSKASVYLAGHDHCAEYLEDLTLRKLLKRYSEFLQFPIELYTEKTEYESVVDEEKSKEGEDPVMKSVPKAVQGYDVVNSMRPLWLRSPKEVNATEHTEFYQSAFRAFDEPLKTIHFSLEGQVQLQCALAAALIVDNPVGRRRACGSRALQRPLCMRKRASGCRTGRLWPRSPRLAAMMVTKRLWR